MFNNFNCTTANELWNSITKSFASPEARWSSKESRKGKTKELLHATLSLADPTQRWMQVRPKPINLALALAEVVWIINGRDDASFLKAFFPNLGKFTGNDSRLHGAYGKRLQSHFEIGDQLFRAYEVLNNNPESRQVVLSIWDPNCDFPTPDGKATSQDIPCNISSILKVDNGALEWLQVMRSNDIFRGLPNNIVQFTSLQEIIAGWLGLNVGSYNHISDSLHVYETDIAHLKPGKETPLLKNPDRFDQKYDLSIDCFSKIAACVDSQIAGGSKNLTIATKECSEQLPEAFRNILFILTAEVSRRSGNLTKSQYLASQCTNELFVTMWNNWIHREHRIWAIENKIPCTTA